MSHSNVKVLTDLSFRTEVLTSEIPVVVDLWAEWCGPCRAFEPVVEELSREYAGRYVFAKLNIEENRTLALELGIRTIPTLLIFKSGIVVEQIVGKRPKADIQRTLEEHLNGNGKADLVCGL